VLLLASPGDGRAGSNGWLAAVADDVTDVLPCPGLR
jgi:hypothetical protein